MLQCAKMVSTFQKGTDLVQILALGNVQSYFLPLNGAYGNLPNQYHPLNDT